MNFIGRPGTQVTLETSQSPIAAALADLHATYASLTDGAVATYIPELAKADPAHFGIAIATVDGEVYRAGDADVAFTIQSISKPFVYALALEDHGHAKVLTKVGVEPTGEAFNSIVMDEVNNRPFNPMVNSGAIATAALIKGADYHDRLARLRAAFDRYAGRHLALDDAVFRSEKETGHRNRAIAYLELNAGMIEPPVDEHLDLYFSQCSLLVTATDLAMMAATLANQGINPATGERALGRDHVRSVLTVMTTCGMYDSSGDWVSRVGLPAKSGVGGGILAVLPGQFGIGIFSPPLDSYGNSLRGIKVCEDLSRRFNLHMFDPLIIGGNVVRRAYTASTISSKQQRRAWERLVLQRTGSAITVYEIQGDLYFASIEQLLRRLDEDLATLSFAIIDGHRVGGADGSALVLLHKARQHLAEHGKRLALAGFPDAIRDRLRAMPDVSWPESSFFDDADAALEWCENQLIAACDPGIAIDTAAIPLQRMDILRDFSPDEVEVLRPYFEDAAFEEGEGIIREGDVADRLFLLAAGSAAVHLRLGQGERSKRLAAFAPGVAFGELAVFDGGTRTADVIATSPCRCYVLTLGQLARLRLEQPDIHLRLLITVGKNLSELLRRSLAEVRALER